MTKRARLIDYSVMFFAAVFGVGSVLLLVAGGSSGFTNFGWSERDILLWDAFLSFLFFIQHSGMVRRSFKLRLASVVSPRYHGAVYTIASGIALALVAIFWQRSQISLLILEGVPRLIAAGCSFLAVFMFALSAYSLRTFDPLGIGPIRAHVRKTDYQPSPLVVRGPYRWVRHPLYTCVLVMFWANPDVTLDRLLFNLLWTGWICVGTFLEERDLAHEFGDAYRQYQKSVPMLIPWRGPQASRS